MPMQITPPLNSSRVDQTVPESREGGWLSPAEGRNAIRESERNRLDRIRVRIGRHVTADRPEEDGTHTRDAPQPVGSAAAASRRVGGRVGMVRVVGRVGDPSPGERSGRAVVHGGAPGRARRSPGVVTVQRVCDDAPRVRGDPLWLDREL